MLVLNLYFIEKKNWCKWAVSGDIGEFFTKFFLIIENVSRNKDTKNRIIKNGDMLGFIKYNLLTWTI